MGTTLTLDSLRQEIEDNYGPVIIDGVPGGPVKLMPILRMKKEARVAFSEVSKTLGEGDSADIDAAVGKIRDMLAAVCETKAQAERLLEAIGDDGQLAQLVFEKYQEATSLGKAEPSPS